MAIPIISDIIGTIQKIIDWVQRTIPRPVQFLFFLVFLLFIGNTLMPIFFNMMGIFCVEGDKFTNDFYDVPTNIAVTFKIMGLDVPDENGSFGFLDVELNCVKRIYNDTTLGNSSALVIYYDGAFCTNCTRISGSSDPYYLISGVAPFDDNDGMCQRDAYHILDNEKSTLQRWLCENSLDESLIAFGCEPPPGFHFSFDSARYVCHDLNLCGNMTEEQFLKQSLIAKGFTRVESDPTDEPSIVGTTCFGSKTKFTVIGIDLFNWNIWLLLMLIGGLLIVWFKFRR